MLPSTLAFLIALAPVLHISSHNLPSILFYITLLVSLALMGQQQLANTGRVIHNYWPVMTAFSILLLAVVNAALHYGEWPGSNGEGALRLLLGVSLTLLACSYVPPQRLRWIAWGFVAACTLAFAIVLWLTLPGFIRPETPGNIPVAYSAFMALFMAIAFLSIGWKLTSWPRLEMAIKAVAGVLGFAALVMTQARTGWLGIPLFILIGIVLFFNARNRNRAILAAIIATVIAAGAFLSSDVLRHKAVLAYTEAVECTGENSTQDTSICIRFQMWRAALDMAQQDPWTGIGDGGQFRERMKEDSHPKGLVSDFVVTHYFGEPHNDIIFMLATFGIPGALGMLLIYLVPAWYFLRRLGHAHPQTCRVAAAMGLAVCLGFALFGLTELMFRRMNTLGFYAVMVGVFLILSDPRYERPTPGSLRR
ncbi:MAG TPA: hypothetical protein DIS96_09640 [Pusillimonas sp.]|nr:hypothetical protein [Pusillimonas sp.]